MEGNNTSPLLPLFFSPVGPSRIHQLFSSINANVLHNKRFIVCLFIQNRHKNQDSSNDFITNQSVCARYKLIFVFQLPNATPLAYIFTYHHYQQFEFRI